MLMIKLSLIIQCDVYDVSIVIITLFYRDIIERLLSIDFPSHEEKRVKELCVFSTLPLQMSMNKEQLLSPITREISNSTVCRMFSLICVCARIINQRSRALARMSPCYVRTQGGPLSSGNYGNANWPV